MGRATHKLTPKQMRFVNEYLVDLNATAAARRAGYKDPNFGRQLITKTNVAEEIQKQKEKLRGKLEITQERVIKELAAVAFANGTDFAQIRSDGYVVFTPTEALTDEQKKAVASIKEGKFGIEVKTYDKIQALELLGKYLGLFSDQRGAQTQEKNNLLEAIKDIEVSADEVPEAE